VRRDHRSGPSVLSFSAYVGVRDAHSARTSRSRLRNRASSTAAAPMGSSVSSAK
jgi:hypothetical protein